MTFFWKLAHNPSFTVVLATVVGASLFITSSRAANIERPIGLPGVLKVGAEYCARSGECQHVGAAQTCRYLPTPSYCHVATGRKGPESIPQQSCTSTPNAGQELAVFVISASTDSMV